ncbi:response regulator [Candidatus Poribacteria bacterium]
MMQVLTIDDSATMRKIIKDFLGKMGDYTITEAENCDDGLKKLAATKMDLILVDWNMPGMSGIDFVKTVRGVPNLAKTPIVMITSNAEKEQVLSAVMAGVNAYIVKPFTADIFTQKLSEVIG